MRGKCGYKLPFRSIVGSPPRMRGKGPAGQILVVSVGITPACAGKRSLNIPYRLPIRDHSRVCGEKITDETIGVVIQGSPPRMRGKVEGAIKGCLCDGITPACAGKSWLRKRAPSTVWDHPRVCGEKTSLYPLKPILVGSPPRMRGKVFEQVYTRIPFRITPAYAGKRECC